MDIFEMSDILIDKNKIEKGFYEVFYYLPPAFSKDLETSVVISAMWTLDGYYEKWNKIPVNIGYQHNNLIREIIKNSRVHSGSKNGFPAYFGLFFNKEKFVCGCNDGGEYFKREDIKDIWENKKELNEFHKSDDPAVGFHIGYRSFKDRFDELKIDTKNGTFYGIVEVEKYIKRFENIIKK
jgi:hypothetical protein